jgi:predicted SnoaL-like aldol condensation-catalyzing enzyme
MSHDARDEAMRNRIAKGAGGVGILALLAALGGHAHAAPARVAPSARLCAGTVARAAVNCRLVVDFYDAFFNGHDIAVADRALADRYVQHNPDLPDGRQPLKDFFAGYFRAHPRAHSQILRVAASGDLVWLHVHDSDGAGGKDGVTVDIFRVRSGRITEHWDITQSVPDHAANTNTMY